MLKNPILKFRGLKADFHSVQNAAPSTLSDPFLLKVM